MGCHTGGDSICCDPWWNLDILNWAIPGRCLDWSQKKAGCGQSLAYGRKRHLLRIVMHISPHTKPKKAGCSQSLAYGRKTHLLRIVMHISPHTKPKKSRMQPIFGIWSKKASSEDCDAHQHTHQTMLMLAMLVGLACCESACIKRRCKEDLPINP